VGFEPAARAKGDPRDFPPIPLALGSRRGLDGTDNALG